jgi:pSer/pThr/pTyr-binding forkhead associated (FHA) protein
MLCGNCGRTNPPGALYCLDCGQKLRDTTVPVKPAPAPAPAAAAPALAGPFPPAAATDPSPSPAALDRCGQCGTDNPAGQRFCRMCGFALHAPPVSVALPPTTPAAPFGSLAVPPAAPAPPPPAAPVPAASAAPAAPAAPSPAPGLVPRAAPSAGGGPGEVRTDNFGAVALQPAPQLVTILKDGSEGPCHRLAGEVTDIGRYEGQVALPDDPYLSPRHARILRRGDRYYLRDLGSVNGVYHRIREPAEMHHGDVVLIGQQVLRLEVLTDAEVSLGPVMHYGVMLFGTPEQPRLARLVQLTSEGVPRDVFHLYRDETVVGRESGDVVFTDDVFLSRRHVAFRLDRAQRRVTVRDLGSSNGTLLLFRGEREIVDGDIFRIGHHLFRFDVGARPVAPGAARR